MEDRSIGHKRPSPFSNSGPMHGLPRHTQVLGMLLANQDTELKQMHTQVGR